MKAPLAALNAWSSTREFVPVLRPQAESLDQIQYKRVKYAVAYSTISNSIDRVSSEWREGWCRSKEGKIAHARLAIGSRLSRYSVPCTQELLKKKTVRRCHCNFKGSILFVSTRLELIPPESRRRVRIQALVNTSAPKELQYLPMDGLVLDHVSQHDAQQRPLPSPSPAVLVGCALLAPAS